MTGLCPVSSLALLTEGESGKLCRANFRFISVALPLRVNTCPSGLIARKAG